MIIDNSNLGYEVSALIFYFHFDEHTGITGCFLVDYPPSSLYWWIYIWNSYPFILDFVSQYYVKLFAVAFSFPS